MNIIHIEKESILNGEGNRCVVWVSGCNHHCKGCQNPETWDCKVGHKYSENDYQEIKNILQNKYIQGVTFSGGDPLFINNRENITQLAKRIKKDFYDKDIWLYTGYEWEEIKDLEIIKYIDVIVVGKFDITKLDVKFPWAGSTNQRVIDVKKTIEQGKIILF